MSGRPAKYSLFLCLCASALAQAQVTFTGTTSDDAFLATGSPSNPKGTNLTALNFGLGGVLLVASAASTNGEFQSVLKFNLSGATSLFHTSYGTGWTISGISIELTSNVGTAGTQPDNPLFNPVCGGNFVIQWLADDNWVEGSGRPNFPATDGVTYSSLSNLLAGGHEILCTNTYSPPGNNVHQTWSLPLQEGLLQDIADGRAVSLRLYAADDQINYLFNSHNFGNGNEPLIHITAAPLPKILSGHLANGFFHLVGIGAANTSYEVQASPDLATTNWQTLGTTTAADTGEIQFDDIATTNQPQRFYRITR
ncbi:MAG: hypothetical protein V9H26_05885 [Verrucomicrobiota bacterium]|nr:hypothetical protein [Verrucomicrobiota bacterium]MCC6822110.1 hypothetical protein [Limisphaerales bacterium]